MGPHGTMRWGREAGHRGVGTGAQAALISSISSHGMFLINETVSIDITVIVIMAVIQAGP